MPRLGRRKASVTMPTTVVCRPDIVRPDVIDRGYAKELLTQVYRATGEADLETLARLITDDFEFTLEASSVEATAYVGAAGFLQAVGEWRAAWRAYRATPRRFRALAD